MTDPKIGYFTIFQFFQLIFLKIVQNESLDFPLQTLHLRKLLLSYGPKPLD